MADEVGLADRVSAGRAWTCRALGAEFGGESLEEPVEVLVDDADGESQGRGLIGYG